MFVKLTEIWNEDVNTGVKFWLNMNEVHVLEKKEWDNNSFDEVEERGFIYGTRLHCDTMIRGEQVTHIDVLEAPEEILELIRRERNYGRK